jgi:hypothetical protein
MNNIVLVHDGFVDGSGCEGVYRTLKKDGYNYFRIIDITGSLRRSISMRWEV